jgi:hypothetical protein
MTENNSENRSPGASGEQPAQSYAEGTEAGMDKRGTSAGSGPPRSPNLIDMYRDWVNVHTSRTDLYRERIDAAKESLEFDIAEWKKALETALQADPEADDGDRLALHHVSQFSIFLERGYDALLNLPEGITQADAAEVQDFRALVVGVFTSQWLLLRDVVLQRAAGSPYRPGLRTLDKQARGHYARLYDVLKPPTLNTAKIDRRYRCVPLADFPPLVYLGNIAQLTVFNRRVPLMLSIPFGALPGAPASENTGMAIPHEVSHAVFAQVPELIEEIKRKLKEGVDGKEGLSQSQRVLYNMAIQWTEEICADLFGTALAGEANATSARWVMAGSDSMSGVTDETHPPALLRPMIHLLALTSIDGESGGMFAETRRFFEEELKKSPMQIQLLGRQFRSVPALMFVPIGTVSDVLVDLIEGYLLKMELEILNGNTIEWLLRAINRSAVDELPKASSEDGFDPWGESRDINSKEFVLDFQAETAPTYGTPGVSKHPDCCAIWFLRSLCC